MGSRSLLRLEKHVSFLREFWIRIWCTGNKSFTPGTNFGTGCHFSLTQFIRVLLIQGDSGGKVSILGGDSQVIGEKKVHMDMCVHLNGYRD
jgi:hypothetical protein